MVSGAAKLKALSKYITEGRYKGELVELTQYTVLKFPRVFQYAMYLVGYNREDICEKDTNKLWMQKLKVLVDDKFFERIDAYSQLGARAGVYPRYRNINAVERNLEEVKDEEVSGYSIAYGQLLRWVKESIKVRKQDIAVRKAKRQAAREEREAKIKEKEEWEKKRAEELKTRATEAEANWVEEKKKEQEQKAAEETDEFGNLEGVAAKQEIPKFEYNETEMMADWMEQNPPVEIPPEVVEEPDTDYDQAAAGDAPAPAPAAGA